MINSNVEPPKNAQFGYVEFALEDTTVTQRFTIVISEELKGVTHHYGFLGPDNFIAPFPLGYTKTRRIPLNVGHHSLDVTVGGTVGPAHLTVNLDVVESKVTPVKVWVDQAGSTESRQFNIGSRVGELKDP